MCVALNRYFLIDFIRLHSQENDKETAVNGEEVK